MVMDAESLEQQAKQYEQQAQAALANFHRLSGAAIEARRVAKELRETPEPLPEVAP